MDTKAKLTGGDEKTTMSVDKLSVKCADKGGDGKEDLSMAGLSRERLCKGTKGTSVQDEDLGEIPDMSVAKLSMQVADTWGR